MPQLIVSLRYVLLLVCVYNVLVYVCVCSYVTCVCLYVCGSCGGIDTIDYVQGIGNGPINPLHLCPKPNTFSM